MNSPTIKKMENIYSFLMEQDKLKCVMRRAYISDQSRNENSAEHSWHLSLAILMLKEELNIEIDIVKAIKMSLVHDICEIGAGDISIYDPERTNKGIKESEYINKLSAMPIKLVSEIKKLWEEYEAQSTIESRWVKVVDRLLPFMMNLNTNGRTWREQGIRKSQVIQINQIIAREAQEIYEWMLIHIDKAVEQGWLIDS